MGLLGGLLFIVGLWAGGRYILAPYELAGMTEEERLGRLSRFNSTVLSRFLLLLYVVYPGVAVAILDIFSCTTLPSGGSFLNADPAISCRGATHAGYISAAVIWVAIFPIGIPLFFIYLLHRFKVPQLVRGSSPGAGRLAHPPLPPAPRRRT